MIQPQAIRTGWALYLVNACLLRRMQGKDRQSDTSDLELRIIHAAK